MQNPAPQFLSGSPGTQFFDKANVGAGPVATVPFKPEPQYGTPYEGPRGSLLQSGPGGKINQIVSAEQPGINLYGSPVAGVDSQGNPVFFQPPKGGGAPSIVPGVRPPPQEPKPLTESQGTAALFGSRASEADQILRNLESDISLSGLAAKQALENAPLIGGLAGPLANAALSDNQQKVDQAQRNFVNAVLRKESGAVINPEEFANAKQQYFPQPGDSRAVIEQKRANRKTAIEGLKRMSGSAGRDIKIPTGNRDITRTGIDKTTGRRVIQYSDGSIEYAD